MRGLAEAGAERLRRNPYPGRGLIIGLSPCADYTAHIYFITGRSAGSRNRMLEAETVGDDRAVTVRSPDEGALANPELYVYRAMRCVGGGLAHVTANGRQADDLAARMGGGEGFGRVLEDWTYEPDPPIYTPRISGASYHPGAASRGGAAPIRGSAYAAYELSVLKARGGEPGCRMGSVFSYGKAEAGYGHMVHTYADPWDSAPHGGAERAGIGGPGPTDAPSALSDPPPPFEGEPTVVPILPTAAENLRFYYGALDGGNRVAICVKWVDNADASAYSIELLNRYGTEGPLADGR